MMPKKKYFRQRAHSNPMADHCFDYPVSPDKMNWQEVYPEKISSETSDDSVKQVEFVDVGCGYGGLLVKLSPLFPDTLMLGMEIRVKVSTYVQERIKALRILNEGSYNNVACIRSNAMKYMVNFFNKGQLKKVFFLYPDPHFKRLNINGESYLLTLLDIYAYVMAENAVAYTITDVKDLHEWMVKHFTAHPLFEQLSQDDLDNDEVVPFVYDSTEEGQKVTRNSGEKYLAVFRRVKAETTEDLVSDKSVKAETSEGSVSDKSVKAETTEDLVSAKSVKAETSESSVSDKSVKAETTEDSVSAKSVKAETSEGSVSDKSVKAETTEDSVSDKSVKAETTEDLVSDKSAAMV